MLKEMENELLALLTIFFPQTEFVTIDIVYKMARKHTQ